MRHRIAAAVLISAFVTLPSSGWAGPKILATNVTAKCVGLPGGTIATVAVTLDNVTNSFYGAQLHYHFQPAGGGSPLTLPTPAGNTGSLVRLFVPVGTYNLVINNQLAPGGNSTSPTYPVVVSSNQYSTVGSKKLCRAIPKGPVQKKP